MALCIRLLIVAIIVVCYPISSYSMMTPTMIRDLLAVGESHFTPFEDTMESNVSLECRKDLIKLVVQKPIGKIALALDATGKPSAGFLVGNWAWLGHFDECMAIDTFRYCLSYIRLKLPPVPVNIPLQWGICTPESCSNSDVLNSLNLLLDLISAPFNDTDISAAIVQCSEEPPAPFTKGFWATLSLSCFFALLMITGALQDELRIWRSKDRHGGSTLSKPSQNVPASQNTTAEMPTEVYEVRGNQDNHDNGTQTDQGVTNEGFRMEIDGDGQNRMDQSKGNELDNDISSEKNTSSSTSDGDSSQLSQVIRDAGRVISRVCQEVTRSFAFNLNLESLMNTKTTNATIRCLDGIRVLSMTWIILGHVPSFLMGNTLYANAPFALEMLTHFGFQVVVNAYLAVDSFFFLSGLLVTYMTLKRMVKTNGHIPWFCFYFQRYWRLTPAMAFSMLIWMYIRPLLGEGPKWAGQVIDHGCSEGWWANLLYINNFVHGRCISWVWYLANDFQFFVISPIFILLLYKKPRIGFGALIVTCVASVTTTAVLMVINDFNARLNGMLDLNSNAGEFQQTIYVKPYCRIPPYLVGMAVGYLLHMNRDKRISMHPIMAVLGWIAASAIGMACVYGFYPSYHGNELSTADSAAYMALSKFAWAVSVAWVVIACHHGYGGWVNSLLSWRFWIPLSRLSYSNYLLHPIILTIITFNFRSTYFYSNIMFAFGVSGIILLSYGAALFLWLVVETPFSNLAKSLMGSSKKNS
ncbi:nose resistant to fluoxetine protein 6-like isoform X1 [Lytechinus variegatus]|uniref:nose resistant to fluoxetine protein 6-like isoform X1 n=1 Tax=Lytechinus variegatus TaxID=7654 RepID=UPI001BB293C3|nr:nose resistant to fluoxetine protein 6-like isoform X1 [Lytechinus variegatus]